MSPIVDIMAAIDRPSLADSDVSVSRRCETDKQRGLGDSDMSFEHSNVYIVRVVDVDDDGAANTWFVGPYGSTRADQTADELRCAAEESRQLTSRECHVEALFSDNDCLRVADYDRATHGSLR